MEWKKSLRNTFVLIGVFALLNIYPIVCNPASWVVLMPYFSTMVFAWIAQDSDKPNTVKWMTVLKWLSFVMLIWDYVRLLTPQKLSISLGTAAVASNPLPKVVFALGGAYALVTILWGSFRKKK